MTRTRLFVKSKKTTRITGYVSVESIGAAHTATDYAEGSEVLSFSPDDAWAKNSLAKLGIQFDLVDLSKGIGNRLKGTLRGIHETPTLMIESSPSKRYVGAKEISLYLSDARHRTA